jgi:hypothetical protein
MTTKYIHELHIIATAAEAQKLSDAMQSACPDVGPNNLCRPLNADGSDKAATHYLFSAPITDIHLAAFEPLLNGVGVKWWLTERDGTLKKKFDNAKPTKAKFTEKDAMSAVGLKQRVVAPVDWRK